jgi:hypothetical protein
VKAKCSTPTAQLLGQLVLVAAVFAAFAIGADLGEAFLNAGILLAFVLVVHFGRMRSPTLETMGGIGDERTQQLYLRATSFTGTVLILTIVVWWLVSIAQGDPSQPIGILAAIGGAVFIASAFVLQRRS